MTSNIPHDTENHPQLQAIRPAATITHHDTAHIDSDGIAQFHRPTDQQRETQLADIIRQHLNLDHMAHLGDRSHIDYIAVKNGRAIAGAELISRNYTHQQLTEWGGVYLKTETLHTAQALANTPLSINWKGVFFFYDLEDGLYWQEARRIEHVAVTMIDPRQANASDTEPGIAIQNLQKWITWTPSLQNVQAGKAGGHG
jgi:hypothetical protein